MIKELRKKFVDKIRHTQKRDKFIPLNDMFSYGRAGNTLHMHIVPTNLRDMKSKIGEEQFYEFLGDKLEDFLCKLQPIVREDTTIINLSAISPIFFHDKCKEIHEKFGFDPIKEILLDDTSSDMPYEQRLKFLQMFNKNGKNGRRVFYTNMSRENLLSTQFHKLENTQAKTK